jgi:hypothetical protein
MPRSPTLDTWNTWKEFKMFTRKSTTTKLEYLYTILLIYPFIVLFFLLYLKPSFIMEDSDGFSVHKRRIDYNKLILWFVGLQLPFIFYFLMK